MGSIGDANEFLLAVFTIESIGLAAPTPLRNPSPRCARLTRSWPLCVPLTPYALTR